MRQTGEVGDARRMVEKISAVVVLAWWNWRPIIVARPMQ